MKDITDILNKYRECARHLWNNYFFIDEELSSYTQDQLDRYEAIDRHLFAELILDPLAKVSCQEEYFRAYPPSEPLSFLHIVPSVSGEVPILINRSGASGYWDDPVNKVASSEVDLRFIEYFDWNSYGRRDFKFYRVRIVKFLKYPQLEGRDALLEVCHARVFIEK